MSSGRVLDMQCRAYNNNNNYHLLIDLRIHCIVNGHSSEGDEEVNIQNREERTMKRLKQIVNSIHRSIRGTVDFPYKHENGCMPILDTEQWIDNVQVGDVIKPQILHSHYPKPMASKYVCLKDSAMLHQNKMNILINDLIRIMQNVSSQCKNDERWGKIQEYLLWLQHSGYK